MKKEIQDALSCLLSMALKNDKYESQKEQYKIVNDYITNLQERLYKALEEVQKSHQEYIELQERIDKAIDFIDNLPSGTKANFILYGGYEVKDILQGSDK